MENKQSIADALVYAVRQTRAGEDVTAIEITSDGGYAIIRYNNGAKKLVNIDGDSGIAMIADVCRALM